MNPYNEEIHQDNKNKEARIIPKLKLKPKHLPTEHLTKPITKKPNTKPKAKI